MTRLLWTVLAWMMVATGAGVASADVVMPPPEKCPEGYTPQTGHHGPYCQPPPPESCPEGHTPKVSRDHAYCEPPADPPCPLGSVYTSSSETKTWCQAGWTAPQSGECSIGYRAVESALCVQYVPAGRIGYEVVSGTCETDADCTGKGESCNKAIRCVAIPKPAPPADKTPPPADVEPASAADPAPAATGDDDDPTKARCSLGDASATPRATALGGLAALAALLVARRRR